MPTMASVETPAPATAHEPHDPAGDPAPNWTEPTAVLPAVPAEDAEQEAGRWAGRPCPDRSLCDGCGVRLRRGWWVRPTCGRGDRPWMCCACWWGQVR
jgi:hypothetical protein